jgi:methionine-gamma-lyase
VVGALTNLCPSHPGAAGGLRASRLDDISYADIQGTGGLRETWYSRFDNPTVDAAGAEVARLHGAARSLMTASGMAPIATTLVTLLA